MCVYVHTITFNVVFSGADCCDRRVAERLSFALRRPRSHRYE